MDVVKLIRGVKSREPLWDRKHALYHDRIVTMSLWEDVAVSLGVDSETVRTKWKGLRDTFRGELRKLHKGLLCGKPKTSTNWEYFDEMMFVKDQIYSNKRHLEELVHPKSMDDSNSCEAQVKTPKTEDETDDDSRDKPSIESDDDFNFLMSLLPQLRCLPTTRNLYVRLKIQELLYSEILALQCL